MSTAPPAMNCDAIAPFYNVLEHISFGPFLERTRFHYLSQVRHARRALLCGDGDGRFLSRLLQENPSVEIDFVDLSGKMIQLAARRVSNLGATFRNRVQFHNCDIRDFSCAPNAPYDLVTAHFFMDCFTDMELSSVAKVIRRFSAPAARCIVSEFREIPSFPGRQISRAVIHSLYAAFSVATHLRTTRLPDHANALRTHGFQLQHETFLLQGLLHSSLWEFQPECAVVPPKPSGVGNVAQSSFLPR